MVMCIFLVDSSAFFAFGGKTGTQLNGYVNHRRYSPAGSSTRRTLFGSVTDERQVGVPGLGEKGESSHMIQRDSQCVVVDIQHSVDWLP